MCIAAQVLLLESELLLLLHMPRTATFVPRTAHFVAEARLFLFTWFSPVRRRASAEETGAADQQECVFGSCECNKHSVLKIFMIDGLNFQTV